MDRRHRSHPTLTPLSTHPPPSPSYIYPSTSIPSTPSLLSRPTSSTRLRPQPRPSKSTSALGNAANPKRRARKQYTAGGKDEDWLTRTASTLTLTRLEEKGQSWLVARESSTSLVNDEEGDEVGGREGDVRDRAGSGRRSREWMEDADEGGAMGPDFVDAREEDEDEGEEVDEGEMRKVVMGRVGGWVDWAIGWLDIRGEDRDVDDEQDVGSGGEEGGKGELDPVELQKRLRRKKRSDEEVEGGVGKPPEGEQAGVWSDAKWLLGVARKVAL